MLMSWRRVSKIERVIRRVCACGGTRELDFARQVSGLGLKFRQGERTGLVKVFDIKVQNQLPVDDKNTINT